jgi:hypothetical protein
VLNLRENCHMIISIAKFLSFDNNEFDTSKTTNTKYYSTFVLCIYYHTAKRTQAYFECIVNVALQLSIVPHEVDDVLVTHDSTIPQHEDDYNVKTLCHVQVSSHIIDHGTSIIQTSDVPIAVKLRCIVTLDVQPDTC